MNSESYQRSGPPDRPIDPSVVRVLRALDPVAREADCGYFVAGATARDLILVNVHGLRPGRATRDIDFGIAIDGWEQFARLKELLAATDEFVPDRKVLPVAALQSPQGRQPRICDSMGPDRSAIEIKRLEYLVTSSDPAYI